MSEEDMKEMVGGCCVCSDERGWDENPLVYCDGQGCNVAVHQACYGIVTVPSGPWFCRKCESQERAARVKCDLCPSRDGALKRTDQGGWAHVVCALYIPEVRFGNVSTMEPILISLVPADRFGRTCNLCENNGRASKAAAGACMQCNKLGCKQNFHVTCAQMQGLLCEEAGNMDNVKYCGYCQHHSVKLKSTKNVKIIPAFKPAASSVDGGVDSPESSPEKGANGKSLLAGSSFDKGSLVGSSSSSGYASSFSSRASSSVPTGDYTPARKTGSSNSISPDIDSSSSKGSKSSKKGSSGSYSSKSESSSSNKGSNLSSSSITPKIAPPVLTPSVFSSVSHKNGDNSHKEAEDKSESSSKNRTSEPSSSSKDDSFTVKLERVDNPFLKSSSSQPKKDVSTLHLKEVVTPNSKYESGSTGIPREGGGSGADSSQSNASASGSHKHVHHSDKPAPPDIKPHVTLTPIPMRSSNRGSDEREEKQEQSAGPMMRVKNSSSSTITFHNSYPHKTSQESEVSSTATKPPTSKTSDMSPTDLEVEKSAPPAKRPRGGSKDEERGRKSPSKGRGGGRRGAATAYGSKRDAEEEDMDVGGSTGTRGPKNGGGRKPAGSSRFGGRPAEDPPAPSLAQWKAQKEAAAAAAAASSDSSVNVLPTHMFGNVLNPASSMAQKMVDTLSQEMEAVVAAGAVSAPDTASSNAPLVGIPLPGKSNSNLNAPLNGTTTGGSASSTSTPGNPPQTLEQLLERQWEQGSQFLMEQAQHLDIAQLLSCLNQLKQDNRALEEHVQTLIQRKEHLMAVNARLSIPLGSTNAMGPLGPVFNAGMNGSQSQNGHGTPPPPTLQSQVAPHSSVPKGLIVNSSTPSPQNHHDVVMQSVRLHRDDRMYPVIHSSRAEISVARPTSSPHGQSHHRSNVAPYGYPGPAGNSGMGGGGLHHQGHQPR